MRYYLLVVTALGCGLAACRPAEGDLSGDVFIVTKGRENVKLGLVEVRAVPESDMRAFLALKRQAADSAQRLLRKEYESAKAASDSTNAVLDSLKAARPEIVFWIADYSIGSSDSAKYADAATRAIWKAKLEEYRAAARRYDAIGPEYERWQSVEYYFDGLPASPLSVKTDADGRFALRVKRKAKYVLVATTSRDVAGSTETYHWIVPASLDGQPNGRVMLTNDNQLDPGQIADQVATLTSSK